LNGSIRYSNFPCNFGGFVKGTLPLICNTNTPRGKETGFVDAGGNTLEISAKI